MATNSDTVHTATTPAGTIAEIQSLRPGASHYVVPTRTPEDDATFVEALRLADHPTTRQNLLRIVRELQVPAALDIAAALLEDSSPDVRGEAADTLGGLASLSQRPVSDTLQHAARDALLRRWGVETDDTVRSYLAHSLVSLAEPRLSALFEAFLTDRDDRVRHLGQQGLARLAATPTGGRTPQEGPALRGLLARYDHRDLAEIIHLNCVDADPYGQAVHPRQRHIRRALQYGHRERAPGENTVVIRSRFFDLLLPEDSPGSCTVRVTDPDGLPACRRAADHRHRLLLRPLPPDAGDPRHTTSVPGPQPESADERDRR